MRITLNSHMIKSLGVQILSQRGWVLCLQALVFVAVLVFTLSWSDSLCVHTPLLMWTRKDACKVWKATNTNADGLGQLTWWQRACLIEKDWDTMDYMCRDVRLMGNWPVCFDAPYSPIRKDRPCIVYSFGIAYDFRFDDAMAYHNCTVYSFDPSMGVDDHQRSHNVHFKKLGIGSVDNEAYVPRQDGYAKATDRWRIMKLRSIMNSLGHTPETVSLVKMDVESSEWPVLKNLMDEGLIQRLPQVLIEWHLFTDHPPTSQYEGIHADYKKFQSLGFKKFWMRNEGRNHWLPKMESQAETAWINSGYQPKTATHKL